ncbi:hypothetical protein rpr22_CDSx846 [Rickettsia prowazekii str. Rp22]|uniref:Uncharacterized protein n=1 Tax=Rickettsia prowazekii (strain Rp22) TaxID=449216 RepID=D5AY45_RICPP|nr:hypothetical protein rpr22_CDSx846 [Rickettsia prowazekii str. Rp22]
MNFCKRSKIFEIINSPIKRNNIIKKHLEYNLVRYKDSVLRLIIINSVLIRI